MAIASGIVLLWPGAHATSHSGWSRETALDGKFFRVTTADDAGGTGGAATHDHGAAFGGHSHTFTGAAASDISHPDGLGTNKAVTVTHDHSTSATSNLTTETSQTASNDPAHRTVIFKEADGSTDLPDDFLILSDSADVPAGFTAYSAATGKLIKGAATSADGGADAGNDTHTHTANSHTHASKASSAARATVTGYSAIGSAFAASSHTHSISLAAAVSTLQNSNLAPLTKKLLILQNTSGSELPLPDGAIAVWLGTVAGIPADWDDYSSTFSNDFVRATSTTGEIGATAGSTQHTHTGNVHTHSAAGGAASAYYGPEIGTETGDLCPYNHSHAWTIGNGTTTWENCSSAEAYPQYIKAHLVKFTAPAASSTPLRTLMGVGI